MVRPFAFIALLLVGCATQRAKVPPLPTPPAIAKSKLKASVIVPFTVRDTQTFQLIDCGPQPKGVEYRIYATRDLIAWEPYLTTQSHEFTVQLFYEPMLFFRATAFANGMESGRECR